MARPIKVLWASEDVRAELRRRANGRSREYRDRFRAKMILLRLDGMRIKDVAARMSTSMRTVSIWSSRFEKAGLEGLADKGGQRRQPCPRPKSPTSSPRPRVRPRAAAAGWRAATEIGGLMSYGPDLINLFKRGGTYVDKVLKGAKPADLPIQQPTKLGHLRSSAIDAAKSALIS
jgi:hypothetical protein